MSSTGASSSRPQSRKRRTDWPKSIRFAKAHELHPANRKITKKWDGHDSDFESKLQDITIVPTMYACQDALTKLGLKDEVANVFRDIGLGELWSLEEVVYAALTRQFLASARVQYRDVTKPNASTGLLSFIVNRRYYELSFNELCDIFGFSKGETCVLTHSPHARVFWPVIGSEAYSSNSAKHALIRNPVLRYAVAIISSVYFGKTKTAGISLDELNLL